LDRANLRLLNEARRNRLAAMLVTDLGTGLGTVLRPGEPPLVPALAVAIEQAFRSGRSGTAHATPDDAGYFLNVFLPPPRLVILGAVHISQALAPMAQMAGFDVTIIDPRTAFATPDRFPNVTLLAEWPEDALKERPIDPFTALAALTHDPKIDDFALRAALEGGAFYVGALGSRKTHAKRIERLQADGVSEDLTATIHAPIGLNIQAQSPAEIAVAVLAEIIGALRQRPIPTPEPKP
jgi:xanthine dehydrogenase accessory factor